MYCRPEGFGAQLSQAFSFFLRVLPLSGIALWWFLTGQATAQEIGRLYAPRPPMGSAFVRVATANETKPGATIRMNTTEIPVDEGNIASRYRVAPADRPTVLSIDGVTIEVQLRPLSNRFYTIVVARNDAGWTGFTIDEGESHVDDLKAQLRFFNLVPNCEAELKISGGPTIFDAATARNVRSRAINPVQAQLEASCGGRSAPFKLPQLRSGDHYSLFLRETAGTLALSGQFDETEPFRDQ